MSEQAIVIDHLPEGHIVVGHVTHLKVLDAEGELYWSTRAEGLNDMEKYGMATDMADTFRSDLQEGKQRG